MNGFFGDAIGFPFYSFFSNTNGSYTDLIVSILLSCNNYTWGYCYASALGIVSGGRLRRD